MAPNGAFFLPMNISLKDLVPHLLNNDITTPKLVQGIKELSFLYTAQRDEINFWQWDEDIVTSYASFYLPTNMPKFHFLMDQLSNEVKELLKDCEVVDIGTGPGTYLLAFMDYFGVEGEQHFFGVDHEPMMIKQARKLVHGIFPKTEKRAHFYEEARHLPKKRADRLVIFGNSLNEMGVQKALKMIKDLAADYILFIEPGTPEVFSSMLELREELKKADRQVYYPCANIQKRCPVAARQEEGIEDWCHQVIRMTHEEDIERFSQMAELDRKAMPVTLHLYGRKEIPQLEGKARFTRFLNENKHSFQWEVCQESATGLQFLRLEIPKKNLSKKEQKDFKKMSVGGAIEYKVLKELSETQLRVEILNL